MLNSLRNRLILSHLLPSLIIIPLMGVLLVYAVESRILLPTLTRELTGDAMLLAEILRSQPEIWQDPKTSASALLQASPGLGGRIMLLDKEGHLLASSDPADATRIGSIPAIINELPPEQAGQIVTTTDYNPLLNGEAIDVIVPVMDSEQELMGRVRITHRYETVYEQLFQFRFLLIAILAAALIAGAVIGYILALNISTPVQYVAEAIYDLATGEQQDPLPLTGPEEINLQVHAVNFLVTRLNNLEKARRQLLANLVHELGRPLGAIRSGLQALLRGAKQDPELLDELLVGMDEQVRRLQTLLDDLAHLHDQVLGTLELDRQPLALSQWLPRTLRPWLAAAQEQKQQYETAVPADLPTIAADPTRLAQAIDNLVNNAIKYTPAGGKITVSAGTKGHEAWIRVSDNGPGIPVEDQPHVFEPFFRGDQEPRIKEGMGLGLSITRDLIIAHGGHLELDSQAGKGSNFTIWIPQGVSSLHDVNHQST
jgi:two-component system sensor histidine kinase BaeS